jgi:glutathione S-transferase
MLKVHHLNNSRSQRILWLIEELGVDYEIVFYQRDATTRLAPDSLKAIHPLGKSPVITDQDKTVAESGAIIEYLIDTYGAGRLRPAAGTADYIAYQHWLHFAEGSAMLPLMLALYTSRLGEAAAPLAPRIQSEIANHLGYMAAHLAGRSFLVGDSLTGADINNVFVLEAAASANRLLAYPNLGDYLARMQARPAYQRGLERGGVYALGA